MEQNTHPSRKAGEFHSELVRASSVQQRAVQHHPSPNYEETVRNIATPL